MVEGRRDRVRLVATTEDPANPRFYRYDTVCLVPPTANEAAFEAKLREIIAAEGVELVLAARDPDVLVQACWRDGHPKLFRS